MEYPPTSWDIFPLEEFGTAVPRASGALNMELLVQVRPNGRMLDHYRISLGGSRIIDAQFALAKLSSVQAVKSWKCRIQVWPRDVDLRRNMASTGWKDLAAMTASKDVVLVEDNDEPVESGRATTELQEGGVGASVRYAVVVGEDQRLSLQLQGLPAPANTLMGKPAFRGYELKCFIEKNYFGRIVF
jgi:hypothetical protein